MSKLSPDGVKLCFVKLVIQVGLTHLRIGLNLAWLVCGKVAFSKIFLKIVLVTLYEFDVAKTILSYLYLWFGCFIRW